MLDESIPLSTSLRSFVTKYYQCKRRRPQPRPLWLRLLQRAVRVLRRCRRLDSVISNVFCHFIRLFCCFVPANVCQCRNGTPKSGDDCTNDGDFACSSCSDGYTLTQDETCGKSRLSRSVLRYCVVAHHVILWKMTVSLNVLSV